MFSIPELTYLRAQRLARLATVASDGQTTVDAVGFQFDGARFLIGGHSLSSTRKYRNIAAGNTKVSLIVDDVETVDPWTPRGIKVHGTAEIVEMAGFFGPGEYFAITPTLSWSWGVLKPSFEDGRFVPHKTVWGLDEDRGGN